MNAPASYLLARGHMATLQAEAEHERIAREAAAQRRSILKDIASRLGRAFDRTGGRPAGVSASAHHDVETYVNVRPARRWSGHPTRTWTGA